MGMHPSRGGRSVTSRPVHVLILAKEPRPGRVKTRLCPPCSHAEAAELAEAALADSLGAACASGADRIVVALDGRPGDWLPSGVEIVSQGSGGLDERLACAWSHMCGPTLQIGMDTPQLGPELLGKGLEALVEGPCDAVFGPALDGGWWTVGLTRPDPHAFLGVAMSRLDTGIRQRRRLVELGCRVLDFPLLRDVDDIDDARAVACEAPSTCFARTLRRQGHAA
jgi:glycosyltransferase A (GT-A) superfamily protein (DUF2064 family)